MNPAPPWSLLRQSPVLTTLAGLARRQGTRLWLCGGSLRDLLLGLTPPDLDLACAGDALALGRGLAQSLGGRMVSLGREFATCRVVLSTGYLDLAGLRAPDIRADLAARDFTVNALALPLEDLLQADDPAAAIIDPTGGRSDLAARLLRPAGPGVLAADPLRVLRAFRFVSTHGLELAPGVAEDLAGAGPGLFRVAPERLGAEWLALMSGARPAPAAAAMERCQVLTRLVPELAAGRGLEQNPYHHLDVLEHSLACLAAAQELAAGGLEAGALAGEAGAYLCQGRRRGLVMCAALLHDLGKPRTRQPKEPGWASFYRHETVGAGLARRRLRALGLSKADAEFAGRLVGEHMRPFHLLGAQSRGELSDRALRRLLAAAGPELPVLFLLALADTMAGQGPQRPPEAEARLLALYELVAARRDQELAAALAAPPLLGGRELMAALGLAQGPEVGRLLGLLREAQLEGRIQDKEQAIALARRALAGPVDSPQDGC